MEKTLSTLVRKRAAFRGHVNRHITNADTLMNEKPVDFKELQIVATQVETRLTNLNSLNNDILSLIEDTDQFSQEADETEEFTSKIEKKLLSIQMTISDHKLSKDNSKIDNSTGDKKGNLASDNTKLPKLSLPSFSGNIMEWQTFWDAFKAAVHSRPDTELPKIQKFQHLRSLLKEQAAACIAGLPLTNDNYTEAIELLVQRFGQPHKIMNAHLQALSTLQAPQYNVHSLTSFRDELESHVRSLDAMCEGEYSISYSDMLASTLVQKLPATMRSTLVRQLGNRHYRLTEIRKFLRNEIEILEIGSTEYSNVSDPFVSTMMASNKHSTGAGQQNFTSRNNCAFCKSSTHTSYFCENVKDVDERLNIVKKSNLCYNCLSSSHHVSVCTSKFRCRICKRKHHSSLCDPSRTDIKFDQIPRRQAHELLASTKLSDSDKMMTRFQDSNTFLNDNSCDSAILKTAVCDVASQSCCLSSNILFDDGSQSSFITESLAAKLHLASIGKREITLSAFGTQYPQKRVLDIVTVTVLCDSENVDINLLVVPHISTPLNVRHLRDIHTFEHLRNLKLAHPVTRADSFEIDILIGSDQYYNLVGGTQIRGDSGPIAISSKLGYLLAGPIKTINTSNSVMLNVTANHLPENSAIEKFWSLESIGIEHPTNDTEDFLSRYCESIEYRNNTYVAPLPWMDNHDILPTNFDISYKRSRSTVLRLFKKPELLSTYDQLIKTHLARGFIEKVPIFDLQNRKIDCHYVPHHAVFKQSATTPMRIVFDCSCKSHPSSPSLNDCLATGPALQNDVSSILLRFRLHKYAVISDIEKAFLHIELAEKDRDFTRFLWLSDPNDPYSDFEVFRFRTVLFGARSSPFILNCTILKHLMTHSTDIAKHLMHNVYVDNFIASFPSESELLRYFHQTRSIMSKGNFNVREWSSNSHEMRSIAQKMNILNSDSTVTVLGLKWDVNTDNLTLPSNLRTDDENVNHTKREILRDISGIYDPLGLIGPVTVTAKVFMQKLWMKGLEWDQIVNSQLSSEWIQIKNELLRIRDATFPRTMGAHISDYQKLDLHTFCDASKKAYGTVCYAVFPDSAKACFLMSKNRVAPLKELTIPQLELLGALLGARLSSHITTSFTDINMHHYFWTDSTIVLYWLNSNKQLPVFVANRVNEIRLLTHTKNWRYCPSDQNPADCLTHGSSFESLHTSGLWREGPPWISNHSKWPSTDHCITLNTDTSEFDPLCHKTAVSSESNILTNVVNNQESSFIDISRFSTFGKARRIAAYALRFITNSKGFQRVTGKLSLHELKIAELHLNRQCQRERFSNIIDELATPTSSRNKPIIQQLQLFLDGDNVIRSGGRIGNVDMDFDTKFPILLPAKHHWTTLLIRHFHMLTLHAGVNQTISSIRHKFWIPRIRQIVKHELRMCVPCKKVNGSPFPSAPIPHLPEDRVSVDKRPFEVTGVDFSGHLTVRDSTNKVYICLFTCANIRAVHLELMPNLTTESFLRCFRRFTARRGLPSKILSDNASTFESAAAFIKQLMTDHGFHSEMSDKNIKWTFIPKRAPWFGGFWERLIGVTKTVLRKVLWRKLVSYDELSTIVTEAEATINDRPLTYVSSDVSDLQPVTPSSLMFGRNLLTLPTLYTDENEWTDSSYNEDNLKRISKRLSHILEEFRSRWKSEYLLSLREHFNKNKTQINGNKVQVGDVVQIHDDCKRSRWKLGLVTELHVAQDNYVRSVTLRTVNGITNRPIVKLYPLEVRATESISSTSNPRVDITDKSKREQRKAAIEAAKRISNLFRN